jgi:hypothetical protein
VVPPGCSGQFQAFIERLAESVLAQGRLKPLTAELALAQGQLRTRKVESVPVPGQLLPKLLRHCSLSHSWQILSAAKRSSAQPEQPTQRSGCSFSSDSPPGEFGLRDTRDGEEPTEQFLLSQ